MIKNFIHITRFYALPMSFFSWLIAFIYSYTKGGNIYYGLVSLVGICLVHLGVNVFDDYIDYKNLPKETDKKGKIKLKNAQNGKCEYIINSTISHKNMLFLSFFLFFSASLIGFYFIFNLGFPILIFMILAGCLGLFYPIAGKYRLCELILFLLYGPLLFGGVFLTMNGFYDIKTLFISIPTALMTLNLLYTDTVLDYDIDKNENKKTIANFFSVKNNCLIFQIFLIFSGYFSAFVYFFIKHSLISFLLILLTVPFAINLLKSIKQFITNPEKIPDRNFFDGITERWDIVEKENSQCFMLRMYQARNLMILFSVLFGIALIIS